MRFLLYNVRYCAGTGTQFHFPFPWVGYLRRTTRNLQRITAFIRSQHPDIVGLVEVDGGSYRTRKKNQAEVIASALGQYHLHESKYGEASLVGMLPLFNRQINAFLTNDVVKAGTFHYFTKGVKRLVIELELENLTVFLVHLSLVFLHRHHQLGDLYALVKKVRKPVIVAGDFNAFWGATEMRLFLAATALKNANAKELPSYPSRYPKRQLDFILHSPEIHVSRFCIPQVTLSDHRPLVCDFSIR